MSLIENKSLTLADNEQFIRAVSVVSSQLNTKARLGAVSQTFDPNAIDGDGDGKVQDGSPFERPAVISAITSSAQRVGKILSKAGINKQSRAKEYNRRYSGMSAQDISVNSVPANFNEWAAQTYERLKVIDPYLPELNPDTTPQDIKELARKLEEFVEPDLIWMLSPEASEKYKADKLIDKNKAFSELVDKSFDFSPKTVAKNRRLVEHVLTTNPQFRELVNKHGMPPIFGFGEDMDDSHMATGFMSDKLGMGLRQFRNPKSEGRRLEPTYRAIEKWFMNGIMPPSVGSKKTKRWTARAGSPEALMIHEYGHYLSDTVSLELSDLDIDQRTEKWQAWRFAIGSSWQDVFSDIGSPEWYEKYKLPDDKKRSEIPDEIPHIETAYGESSPTEAFAESISAMFAHNGEDQNLVSQGMKDLIADFLSLDSKRDIREQLTPKRTARQIIPDGFASRGAVAEINNERDAVYGEITDPRDLTQAVLGQLDGDDPVGKMVRQLQAIVDDPEEWSKLTETRKEAIRIALNIRVANDEESRLLESVLTGDLAFSEMIRRHGIANIYFSQTDLRLSGGHDTRGVLSGGFVPDDEQISPPRIIIDLIGAPHERNLPDQPMPQSGLDEMKKYSKGKAPGNVTRISVSRNDKHVIRHEGGHAIHDNLWEKQHRGEITGRRAKLIRAYGKRSWEEFYSELGRPDLWREHQRVLKATYDGPVFRRWLSSTTPSPEIGQVDSAYAWANPREMFAESFSAYTSSNPAFRELLNDTMIDHLQSILGDADNYPDPPSMVDGPRVDTPEPPPWDGFASVGGGEPPKSYRQLRRDYVDNIPDDETFSRSKFFQNTTTDQKVDLAVPADEDEWALMAWDLVFENLQIKGEVIKRIDFSDPFNPTLEDDRDTIAGGKKFFKGFLTFGGYNLAETRDLLEYQGFLLQRDKPDFSPDIVKANRDAIRATLDAFPRFREMSERFGLPPITTMSSSHQERVAIEMELSQMVNRWQNGEKLPKKFDAVMPFYSEYSNSETFWSGNNWEEFIKIEPVRDLLAEWKPEVNNVGGFYSPSRTISLGRSQLDGFIDGTRVDHTFAPTAGDFLISGDSLENTILHEYGHYMDNTLYNRGKDGKNINNDIDKLFKNVADHIKTEYGRTERNEFVAEIVAAVLSGSRDQEEMLSPEARQLARQIAGLPERDPVFAGRIAAPSTQDVIADRFGELWQRSTDGIMEPLDKERGIRSRDGVPDVLETMMDAKLRTGLQEFEPVEFEHNGRTFSIREAGNTFEIEINGRTVAQANVTPGKDGLPEIDNVDVLPGYSGVAPDQDLHEMIVDHARKKYPSARAPRRARKAEVVSEGFASIGPEHHDARGIDGTPGTPEYTQAITTELAAAQAAGKKVFFDYNGETREVEVVEIFEKNGFTYMKGNDALRDGAERMFRLDRVSMPKRVENPETGAAEVVKKPGKPPRKPVPVFTGKAAELFEGAASWEEVAERLSKGRYVFFDFETTGIEENKFSTQYNHPGTPTQIGLVEIVDGKVTRRWSTHVNPGRPMSIDPETGRSWSADNLKYKDPATGELMNLTDEWLAQQKPLKDALEEMLEFIGPIGDTILGGQNHPYDDDVMKRAMADSGLDPSRWSPGGFIDSQALAQALLDKNSDDYPRDPEQGYKTVSLGPLATWLGHDMGGGWHSADADSEASYEAFKRLVDRAALHEGQGITVRRDLLEVGGGEKEFKVRLDDFENQKRGWDWKVKKYRDQQSAPSNDPATDGFASRGLDSQTELESSQERGIRILKRDFKTPEEELESVNQSLEMGERAPIGSQSLRLREFNTEQELLKRRKKYLENLIQRGGKYEPGKGPGLKKAKDEISIADYMDALANMPDPKPKSRVTGVKPQKKGYRAAGTGDGWTSVEDHINIETERGNELFETHQEYLDKGYEVAWVTHTPKEAGRYAISADQVNAFDRDEISVDPANIDPVDLTGSELVGTDGEGGYLYARQKPSAAARKLQRVIKKEEELLDRYEAERKPSWLDEPGDYDGFASTGSMSGKDFVTNQWEAMMADPDGQEFSPIWALLDSDDDINLTENRKQSVTRKLAEKIKNSSGVRGDDARYEKAESLLRQSIGENKLSISNNPSIITPRLIEGLSEFLRLRETNRGSRRFLQSMASSNDTFYTYPNRTVNKPGDYDDYDGFASTGTISVPLDLVSGGGNTDSSKRGGAAQRDREVVPDDWNTRQQKRIAGVRVPDHLRDEYGAPIPGAPIYRETIKIGRKKYTFEADVNGLVTVYTGRNYKQVAQLNLDRGHSMAGGARAQNPNRHYIDYVTVDKKHRRKGIATQMAEIAEHAYGGSVEHSTSLSDAGRAWRDADVKNRGAAALPLRDGAPTIDSVFNEGFASRGTSAASIDKTPDQMIGERYLEARLDGYQQFGGNVSNAELNMLAIYQSWKEGDEPWESFVARFPALQSMIKKEMSRYERQAATSILDDMLKERRTPRPSMSAAQRESAILRVNNPQLGASNLMAESVVDVGRQEQERQNLQLQKNYATWKGSDQPWEKFVEDNPAIEKLIEKERSSGKLNERITGMLLGGETPEQRDQSKPILDTESPDPFPSLDKLADLMNLDETETVPNRVMSAITGQINQRIASGEATLAEKLGITPEQLKERLANVATEINQFVDRFVHDTDVRRNVKDGLKILSAVSILLGSKEMKQVLSTLNPNFSGGGDGSGQSNNLIDLVDSVLSAGIHEALIAYGSNFANLIATELAAMRLVTRQKAKEMIEEIKKRIEGAGQYIGTMSKEMWARLRGAWAKVRPTAPIGMPATAKQWIVAGSSPQWAEMSWMDYQSKNRLSRDLIPTDTQRWAKIAVKVGQSPELIDIASYRAGIGYGNKRIKPRDVIRVYTT